ncbi:MAG: histidine phosphatase family protein [Myxococcales bacterium FL481]|nr:MAG: histidine phosphatase family protein [Myxococcales bacterium FL481]
MPRFVAALVRHGAYHQPERVPSAHLPHPLNEEGEAQARAAGEEIARELARSQLKLTSPVYCSRLLRAWQTAQLLSEGLVAPGAPGPVLPVEERAELDERCLGSAANLTVDEIERLATVDPRLPALPAGWKSHSSFRLPFPGAESLAQAGARVAGLIQSETARHRDAGDVMTVFVGHGAAFRHAAAVLGALKWSEVGSVSMFHARPVYLEPQGAAWRVVAGRWKPRRQAGHEPLD